MSENEKRSEDKLSFLKNKKNALLNKFLTKTFHMIEQCDQSVASWSADGKSFVIRDVDSFSKGHPPSVFQNTPNLPRSLGNSTFIHFENFGPIPTIEVSVTKWPPPISRNSSKSSAVRFAHEHFRRGQPELLHKITRITKSQEPTSSEMKSLKDDIFTLKKDIVSLSNRFDHRMEELSAAFEADYKQRMSNITLSYQALSALTNKIRLAQSASKQPLQQVKVDHDASSTSEISAKPPTVLRSPDQNERAKIPAATISGSPSPTISAEMQHKSSSTKPQLVSPLMTLSGIATAMINNASEL